ncbi:hypothetical protein SAMN02745866_00569 [Alteromonadaceae bacterium Bs31]|nr:hypothetical protein SAMN02745866_00569 [Alteromonadaceae bacterium Bs31]
MRQYAGAIVAVVLTIYTPWANAVWAPIVNGMIAGAVGAAGIGAAFGGGGEGFSAEGLIAAAVVGGVTTTITGSKFKNGAAGSAFMYALSAGVSKIKAISGGQNNYFDENVETRPDFEYKDALKLKQALIDQGAKLEKIVSLAKSGDPNALAVVKEFFGDQVDLGALDTNVQKIQETIKKFSPGRYRKIFNKDKTHANGTTGGYFSEKTQNIYLSKTAFDDALSGNKNYTLIHEHTHAMGFGHPGYDNQSSMGGVEYARAHANSSSNINTAIITEIHMLIRAFWRTIDMSTRIIFLLFILLSEYSHGASGMFTSEVNLNVGLECDNYSQRVNIIFKFENVSSDYLKLSPVQLRLVHNYPNVFLFDPDFPVGEPNTRRRAKYRGPIASLDKPKVATADLYSLGPGKTVFIHNHISSFYDLDVDFNYYVTVPFNYYDKSEKYLNDGMIRFYLDRKCFLSSETQWLDDVEILWHKIKIKG